MIHRVVLAVLVSAFVLAVPMGSATGRPACSTVDQALGFATEEGLDSFLSLAKRAAQSPSLGQELRALIRKLVTSKEAFVLRGGDSVTIVEDNSNDDPLFGKLKINAYGHVFWVPTGALKCK